MGLTLVYHFGTAEITNCPDPFGSLLSEAVPCMAKDIRLIVTMGSDKPSDIALRERIDIAAKTLGVSKSVLIKACLEGALDDPSTFRKHLRLKR